ncbi:hypothetical protein DFJ74DRAFT_428638 [Hyaloraphidium curvatum]|nr:hypothetical protein DFJ74DRAFT_428638 [Hyaloraphidium curvatum]
MPHSAPNAVSAVTASVRTSPQVTGSPSHLASGALAARHPSSAAWSLIAAAAAGGTSGRSTSSSRSAARPESKISATPETRALAAAMPRSKAKEIQPVLKRRRNCQAVKHAPTASGGISAGQRSDGIKATHGIQDQAQQLQGDGDVRLMARKRVRKSKQPLRVPRSRHPAIEGHVCTRNVMSDPTEGFRLLAGGAYEFANDNYRGPALYAHRELRHALIGKHDLPERDRQRAYNCAGADEGAHGGAPRC